ncbi:Protein farnesyltransferase subunit beta-like Protein [Tribolium castaneum]|uniref:Protein farnesyltransferase subunit beta n=1 Tax=Tribolium castaneum TaxID=7070 RepID=D6WSN3_TRICA|nr:PREDICTED: protein farnesyltransferase subunit beta [Tribolium castaneum]EFA07131.1 Protein farnesyltransferase subunit beta-like Protein [Tribolium castaneum]|eukprot:XP_970739.1 PREDICTED: protein farnesyltransferase subunit beta [Tribolium castaneum]
MAKILPLRSLEQVKKQKFKDEGVVTITSLEQIEVEEAVYKKLHDLSLRIKVNPNLPELLQENHKCYLLDCLIYLSSGYQSLDASRPWLCYWILHALALMGIKIDEKLKSAIAKFLAKCQSPDGGFGGGPGHLAHLAATYAAVNALVILGTEEAYNVIKRDKLQQFLWRMRQPDGSFCMHKDGEIDIRGVYCALAVASLTNVLTEDLVRGTFEWIISCQTYEGGFSGCPGMEAHGGYAFCGLSALIILGKGHLCDLQALLRWTANRQMRLEGGFQGRTNKLVDGCYSFWQGAAFPLIYSLLAEDGLEVKNHLFDERALQEYILTCCQHPQGGLLDKPGKHRDIYHTSYTLSGLSVAQHFMNDIHILGDPDNEVCCTHPVYNIRPDHVRKAMIFFNNLGVPSNHNVST